MKKYNVTVAAKITKTIAVEANDENQAVEIAHELFSVLCDGYDENYKQDTVCITQEEA
jgi:hypothetical protein